MDALHNLLWMDEMLKSKYGKFLKNLAHDSIWNAKNILNIYAKTRWARDTTFKDAILRAELYVEHLQRFPKIHNRTRSISWWRSIAGMVEEASQKHHLIALPPTTRVLPLDTIHRRGGYATIRKVTLRECKELNCCGSLQPNYPIQSSNDGAPK